MKMEHVIKEEPAEERHMCWVEVKIEGAEEAHGVCSLDDGGAVEEMGIGRNLVKMEHTAIKAEPPEEGDGCSPQAGSAVKKEMNSGPKDRQQADVQYEVLRRMPDPALDGPEQMSNQFQSNEDIEQKPAASRDLKTNSTAETLEATRADKLECNICRKVFNWKSDLMTHLHTHKPKHKAIRDNQSSWNEPGRSNCVNNSVSKRNFDGKVNGKGFHVSKSAAGANTQAGGKPYECSICSNEFSDSSKLRTHMRFHTGQKPFECSVCSKKFSQRCDLTRHMRTHTGEKPHVCTVCSSKFSETSKLRTHIMRIHTGEKPHQCSVCCRKFSQSGDLSSHMRTHTGEKPYQCSVCNKRFSVSCILTKHMRIHTGEKPYECSFCLKRFCRSEVLTKHLRTHTREKPYDCSVCNKKFSGSGSLTRHMRIHTGDNPYECSTCSKKFSQSCHLTKHKKCHK